MTKTELNNAINARLEETKSALAKLNDETAVEVTVLFQEWTVGKSYTFNDRVRYEEKLYKCIQAHTSQSDWKPDITPALWVEVAKPGEIPVWKQPTGAHDAYSKGAKVHHPDENGPIYISLIDGNVYEPPTYWELV